MEWKELNLSVTGIEPDRGGVLSVMVFLEDGFPKDHSKAIKRYELPTNSTSSSVAIDVPQSMFALKVHHDEDRSGQITKNWTRFMPAEGLGFSSGARVRFGPPSFEAAKLSYPETGELTIPMIYP